MFIRRLPRGYTGLMNSNDRTSRESAVRTAFRVEYFTVAWMVVEAGVAVASGVIAGSIALVAFGLDSVIELFAAAVIIWQLHGVAEEQKAREKLALRLIAVTFFALAAYVTAEAIYNLVLRSRPETSVAGIALASAAVIVMPVLFIIKRRLARRLGNSALAAEASESLFCALLAAVVLLALALNAAFGWWWADPVAAIVVALFAVREGFEALEDTSGEEEGES